MRICLVSHGFPPYERTGVENYTAALAASFARRGHQVEVFAPRAEPTLPEHSLRRESRGRVGVNWLTVNRAPNGPREMLLFPQARVAFAELLERERPEIVHFQHLFKLGVGLVHEARSRGIPTVYTAHDYYPVCHRYTLLRPDLRHCDVRGDSRSCALCDLAAGYLNRFPALGDYQIGVLPQQLDEARRKRLTAILEEDLRGAEMPIEEVDAAFDVRLELDGLRAEAYTALDLVIAPTRFLAGELARGGLSRERIDVLPYGIENEDLTVLPAPEFDGSRPLRVGFFGGLSKHKGVHVLLDAFERMRAPAELSVWGYSTDRSYVRVLKQRAADVGAHWRGPYERADLPDLIGEVDLLVVPSTWVENYPIVIREAFSARRPVIASDFGAIPESIRSGVDGLLFPCGDADALARALDRCAGDPRFFASLVAGIESVKGIDEQASELLERYQRLVDRGVEARTRELPESLRAFVGRHAELASLPTRDLFRYALAGIDRLRKGFGGEVAEADAFELIGSALSAGSHTQLVLHDDKHQIAWLKNQLGHAETDRSRVERKVRDLERSLHASIRDAKQLEEHLKAAEEYLEAKQEHIDKTEAYIRAKEEDLKVSENNLRRVATDLRHRQRAAEVNEDEHRTTAELALAALQTQEELIGREIWPLLDHVLYVAGWGPAEDRPKRMPTEDERFVDMVLAAREGREVLRELLLELEWRREEMRAAIRSKLRPLIGPTGLGRRIANWESDDRATATEEKPR